jgi:hypothetical protein
MPTVERFDLSTSSRWGLWASAMFFGVCTVLAASTPFLLSPWKTESAIFIYIFCVPVFGFFTFFYMQKIRRMPHFAVALDDNGIWQANSLKDESFVPWRSVAGIVENQFRRRLVLTDRSGNSLIGLEFALKDFDRLRSLIVERANLGAPGVAATETGRANSLGYLSSGSYSRGTTHHLIAFAAVAFVGALLANVGTLGADVGPVHLILPYIGAVVVLGIGYEYLTTVHRLVVSDAKLELHWPLWRTSVTRAEVQSVELSLGSSGRPCRVTLNVSGQRRPVRLRGFDVPVVELYQKLLAWKASKSHAPAKPVSV